MKTPKMKTPPTMKGSGKPAIKMRRIKLAGRSAFPPQAAAFGAPSPDAGPAFSPGPPMGAGGGDTGA